MDSGEVRLESSVSRARPTQISILAILLRNDVALAFPIFFIGLLNCPRLSL